MKKLFYTRKNYEKIQNELFVELTRNERLLVDKLNLQTDLCIKNNEILTLKKKVKEIQGAKGGLTKEINKLKTEIQVLSEVSEQEKNDLKSQINKLKKELKDSMTDKYLVRKIPAGRPRKTEKIKPVKVVKPQVAKMQMELQYQNNN